LARQAKHRHACLRAGQGELPEIGGPRRFGSSKARIGKELPKTGNVFSTKDLALSQSVLQSCFVAVGLLPQRRCSGLEKTMTVQITPKSTQHTGMATSTEGSVAAWQVTFELDEDESLHAAIDIRLAGPPTHQEARQKALKILQVFLNDACEAARKYQFSS
jgi:hypothetical protein